MNLGYHSYFTHSPKGFFYNNGQGSHFPFIHSQLVLHSEGLLPSFLLLDHCPAAVFIPGPLSWFPFPMAAAQGGPFLYQNLIKALSPKFRKSIGLCTWLPQLLLQGRPLVLDKSHIPHRPLEGSCSVDAHEPDRLPHH